MIFLVHYDRRAQRLLRFETYDDSDADRAQEDSFALELSLLGSDRENEIALFKAADEAALRVSHARYFETLTDMLQSASQSLGPIAC